MRRERHKQAFNREKRSEDCSPETSSTSPPLLSLGEPCLTENRDYLMLKINRCFRSGHDFLSRIVVFG